MLALILLTTIALGWGLTELLDDDASDGDRDEEAARGDGEIFLLGNEELTFREGDAGDNSIFGSDGGDFIAAEAGDDRVFGSDGTDDIFGGAGDDFLRGGAGDDFLVAEEGNDTLYGDVGDDVIYSADYVDNDAYLASVRAGGLTVIDIDYDLEEGEADTVFGGVGDDRLFVGSNDVASTGSGADIIHTGVWMEPGEAAIVTDFQHGTDRLVYYADPDAPAPSVSFGETANGDAVVRINGAAVMVLEGVDFETLSTNDVRFLAA